MESADDLGEREKKLPQKQSDERAKSSDLTVRERKLGSAWPNCCREN